MPHIIVKLFPGRTEVQKKQLTSEIVKAIRTSIDVPENMRLWHVFNNLTS